MGNNLENNFHNIEKHDVHNNSEKSGLNLLDVHEANKPKDQLTVAFEQNQEAIKLAEAAIKRIMERAAVAHPQGVDGFLKDHERMTA